MKRRNRRWLKIIGLALGVLMLGGLVGGIVAQAQGPTYGPPYFRGRGWRAPRFLEVAAQELGLEVEVLTERLRDGETLSDIAAEQGKGLRDLTDAFLAAQEEALTEVDAEGYFTQARAVWSLQRCRQRIEHCLAG